jgi:enoyl-CoA hydratase/carnithine racemase
VHGISSVVEGQVATITIDRPEVLNALTEQGYEALEDTLGAIDDDDDVRVAILTGAGGRAFSVGSDLRVSAARPPDEPMIVTEGAPPPLRRTPLIAAIDGYCLGGGLEWALRADIRIATPRSTFGLPEPRTGSVAGFGLHALARLVPPGEALYLQLTGMRVDAERALRSCLVQELVAPERLLDRAHELAAEIVRCSPGAVAVIKQVVDRTVRHDLAASYEAVGPAADALGRGADAREGPRAFVEKRDPAWSGDPATADLTVR